ncbi:MAG TPA: ABC transporter substrate-binding protein [Alphaproteobacteria bacterium]|jgi:phospholipid transport system substrate-binding protein
MKPSKGLSAASVVLAFALVAPTLDILTPNAVAGNAATAAAETSPTAAVRGTINEVLRILKDNAVKGSERTRLLEQTVASRFDYREMSARILGQQWNKLNDGQKDEFTSLLQSFLSASYASKLNEYKGQEVAYTGERLDSGYAEVRTKIGYGNTDIPIDYRLRNKGGEWRAYDVVIDGISLVSNYRGQFTKIIKDKSYEGLVEQLREKIHKNGSTSSLAPATVNPPALMLAGTGGRCC